MSVKIMGMVWDLEIGHDEKLVLLAYADHASHDGTNIYPSVRTIAEKTNYSERSIQVITRKLEEQGILIEDGAGPRGTNKWKIPISGGEIRYTPRGADSAPVESAGVQNLRVRGEEYDTKGCSPQAQGGEVATAPEPSLTIIKPSNEPLFFKDLKAIFATMLSGHINETWQKIILNAPSHMEGSTLEVTIEEENIRDDINFKLGHLRRSIAIADLSFSFIKLVPPMEPEPEASDA